MSTRFLAVFSTLLLAGSLGAAQADQAANAETQQGSGKQKKEAKQKEQATDLADLMGKGKVDKAAAERGRAIFLPNCSFCHGTDAHGKSGPDLVRSRLVLHDSKGETIGPVIRNGRPDRGMPAFPSFSADQIADLSAFLHSRAAAASNRFAYKIGDVITGNAQKGAAWFNGPGDCTKCHSPTGDLAHVASKYDPVELQRRMLYPSPNLIDLFLGRVTKPAAPTKVTVFLPSGEQVSGTLDHIDEFAITMHDSAGWYRSFDRATIKADVQDPRAEHAALLPKYTDADMHNVLAYLETLK